MSTRKMFWVGAMAALISGCSGQVDEPGAGAAKDPSLFMIIGGCGSPTGCTTTNGTGVYYEEGGSAGIDFLHLMITHFTNTSNTSGPYVSFQGRYQNTVSGVWYYLPSNVGRVTRAIYNGVAYKVVGVGESSTYPYFTLQDYANDAPFSVYGYYFPNLKIQIAISTPTDGNWELSFLPSTSGQLFGTDNYSYNTSPNVNTADQNVVYKWDMYVQNLKTLAPPVPYCQRAQQVDDLGNKSTPDDYVAFQKGIDVDPVTGTVVSNTATTNDVTLSCRYGAVATAYYWGYNYTSDLWHYASAIHMKRASYCGDASFYTVSGTQITIEDEVPIEGVQTSVADSNVEAYWTPTGAACYNGPRRGDLANFNIKPFNGYCNGQLLPTCSSFTAPPWYEFVGWAMWYANYYHLHALVDGTVAQ